MKIAILSDTHTKLKKAREAITLLEGEGAEFFIHAGDVVEREVLDLLEATQKRYVAVYGNNDAHLVEYHNRYNLVQEPHYFKLANTKFKLMHLPFYMSADAEVVIFGHTHQFELEMKEGTLFLNPGEVCARDKPLLECAMLEVRDDSFVITYYTKKKKADTFVSKEFRFARKAS